MLSHLFFFFFNDTATTEIYTRFYTLSLHDALPIFRSLSLASFVDGALALYSDGERVESLAVETSTEEIGRAHV